MNQKTVGVLGDGPMRSVMDKRMESTYGHPVNKVPPLHTTSGVGILGTEHSERSVMDRRMQAEYNPRVEGFEYRSVKDKMYQRKFNMIHGNTTEYYGVDSLTTDNPYNPLSEHVKYSVMH